MNEPIMTPARPILDDTVQLGAWMPVPGFGTLAVNAWLLKAEKPMLIDTGLGALQAPFMTALREQIELSTLEWIWITHADADHVGNLAAVLEAAPQARIATTYIGMGKLAMQGFPPDRCHLINPGQTIDLGDRALAVMQPPIFDAPETTSLFDPKNRAFFSSDCFGALLNHPADTAADIHAHALHDGMVGWASADAPWIHDIEPEMLARRLNAVRELDAAWILGSHLPPACDMAETLLKNLSSVRNSIPFAGPDQRRLGEMLGMLQAG